MQKVSIKARMNDVKADYIAEHIKQALHAYYDKLPDDNLMVEIKRAASVAIWEIDN
jgi:hypothetical protein